MTQASPAPAMVLPRYGHSTLADLLPAIGAHLGMAEHRDDPLGLPSSERYVVVLIDGLGWQLVHGAVRSLGYLPELLGDARAITSGVPSTTVTSLTSLGTGLPPGQHGMAGYTCRIPETGEILNALTWDSALTVDQVQPRDTVFEAAARTGIAVSSVTLERFKDSGLTGAALRGPEFVGVEEGDEERRVAEIVRAATRGRRSLVYAYERQLDHSGHVVGCNSETWAAHLVRIDRFLGRLREALPAEVRMVVTGDHGMLDIPAANRVVVEDEPDLLAGVDALAGEGRLRQLYSATEAPATLAARWVDRLGDLAWVRTRAEAIDEGWFGPMGDPVAGRFGDVLVAMRRDWAVMTRAYARELALVGMHGSLTAAEMTVPLFVD